MEWNDEAIILTARPHGESAAIATLLCAEHGRHAGLIAGGQTQKHQSLLQPGTLVKARWNARLLDHLGNYQLDMIAPTSARWMDAPAILGIIASAAALTELCLPERQPMPGVYAGLLTLLSLEDPALWPPVYIKWEMELLRALGYGLDLASCAVTGDAHDLSHVSPRTGRAVSSRAAAPYEKRLLRLPGFLCGAPSWDEDDICEGLALTGHFLTRTVLAHHHGYGALGPDGLPALPPARQRLFDYFKARADEKAA